MKRGGWLAVSALCGLVSGTPVLACSEADWRACQGRPWVVGEPETPIGERWWPNKLWGAGDEAGSTNWYARPEVVRRALAEARSGKTYRLGRFGAEAPQADSRLEGLGQLGVVVADAASSQRRYYNGVTQADIEGTPRKNGVDKLHPIVARGILIDLAGAKGVAALDAGTEITLTDVRDALARQGLSDLRFLPGDAVLFRTGWSAQGRPDNAPPGHPGIGIEVARWLSDDVQAGVTGSDTPATEVVPAKDAACVRCVAQHLLVRHGIVMQHNLALDALAADKAWRFLYVFGPASVAGATGAPGSPVALR